MERLFSAKNKFSMGAAVAVSLMQNYVSKIQNFTKKNYSSPHEKFTFPHSFSRLRNWKRCQMATPGHSFHPGHSLGSTSKNIAAYGHSGILYAALHAIDDYSF